MRSYFLALVALVSIAAVPAWCADPPDFKGNWLKLFKTGEARERSMAIDYLGYPNCTTKEGMAHLRLLGNDGARDDSPLVRESALARLRYVLSPDHHGGCRINDELVTTLLNGLKDPTARVREESVRILGITGISRALPELTALLGDPVFTVRHQTVVALGRIGDRQALPYLLELVREAKEWPETIVQREALYSIRKIVAAHHKTYIYRSHSGERKEEKNQIEPELLERVKATMISAANDPWLRREAFEFFAAHTTPGSLDILQAATGDTDPAIRKMAYDGITRLDALALPQNSCGYERITAALKDKSPGVRAAAIVKLSDCRSQVDSSLLSAQMVAAINDSSQEVSAVAIAASPSIGGMDVLNALVGRFGVEPYETRKMVMESYRNIAHGAKTRVAPASSGAFIERKMSRSRGDNVIVLEGVPPRAQGYATIDGKSRHISEGAASPNAPESRVEAITDKQEASLEAQAVGVILERFASLSLTGKIAALELLDTLNDPRIRPFAVSQLDDPLPRVRSSALVLAKKAGIEPIVSQLFKNAQDSDWGLRYTAIDALLEAEELSEGHSLAQLAEHRDAAVRDSLATVINNRQGNEMFMNKNRTRLSELMLHMLDDADFKVRQNAARYFVNNPDKRSIDKLATMLAMDGPCSGVASALAVQGDMRGNDGLFEIGKGRCDVKNDWSNSSKRIGAATVLRKAKDSRAVSLMCSLLERAEGNDGYELIIQLGETRDKSAAACLVSYGKKRRFGREIMFSLAKIASPEALDFLRESLDSYQFDTVVSKEAITAIAATSGTKALDILLDELRHDSRFSHDIIDMLGYRAMRDNEALSYLFKVAGKDRQALGKIPVEIGLKAAPVIPWQKQVMTLVDNSDLDIRTSVVIALGSFHDEASQLLLEKLATADNGEISILAQQSLATRSKKKNP